MKSGQDHAWHRQSDGRTGVARFRGRRMLPAALCEAILRHRDGTTARMLLHARPLQDCSGRVVWLAALKPAPHRDPSGRNVGVALTAVDSTEQYRARRRLGVLNDASERIGTTLDLARTPRNWHR